jgi:general stress protein 26
VAENGHADDAEGRKKVFELIKDIRVAMLTTYAPEGFLHARPMVARTEEANGDLWFFTDRHSEKIPEIRANPSVALCYSEPSDQNYVSISGTASVVEDRAKVKQLWSEPMRTWFPQGADDPDLILIRVKAEHAQYWDAPSSAVVYAYGYVKARLTGERPDPGEEGKVRL